MTPQELFATLEAKYRLPEGYLNRVYMLESGGGRKNYNEQSGAAGPFQFMPGTAKGMGLADPYDLAQSAEATARLAVQNRDYLMKRGVENVDGGTLYLAHAQGPAGAYALMTNPDKKAVDALSPLYKDQGVAEKAVTQNAGKVDQDAGSFAQQFVSKYEGKAAQARPYSALGETAKSEEPSTDEGITTLVKASEEDAAKERGSSRREMYALNTLMGLTKELEQKPAPMLPIPRLSFAKGGIVGLVDGPEQPQQQGINVPQTTAEVVKEIQGIAEKGNLDEYKIAFLLRMAATNTIPPDRALAFAKEVLSGDVQALLVRFRRYPRALRMLARLDLSLGGLAGQGYGVVANQHPRNKPQPLKKMDFDPRIKKQGKGFADGGEVGGHNEMAMFDLAQFAVKIYGPERANNMIRRSEGDPNKLYFALNQYAKNVVGPKSPNYALNLKALQVIAARHKLQPTKVFNRTEDALSTEQELDKLIRDVPKKDRIFRDALLRMRAMIGWKPKPRTVRS